MVGVYQARKTVTSPGFLKAETRSQLTLREANCRIGRIPEGADADCRIE
jgi:hypothetical protein